MCLLFIYIKISNNLQFLALATVYGHLATVYYLLQKRAPTVNQIVQNGCLQFSSFLGHYFTPGLNWKICHCARHTVLAKKMKNGVFKQCVLHRTYSHL